MLLSSPALFFETEQTSFGFFTIWDLWLLMMVLPLQVHLRGRLWTLQFYANKRAFLHEWRGVLGSCRAAAAPYERIFPWVRRIRLHLCIVKILSVLLKLLASFINCTWHVMAKLFAKAVISVISSQKCFSLAHFIHSCTKQSSSFWYEGWEIEKCDLKGLETVWLVLNCAIFNFNQMLAWENTHLSNEQLKPNSSLYEKESSSSCWLVHVQHIQCHLLHEAGYITDFCKTLAWFAHSASQRLYEICFGLVRHQELNPDRGEDRQANNVIAVHIFVAQSLKCTVMSSFLKNL